MCHGTTKLAQAPANSSRRTPKNPQRKECSHKRCGKERAVVHKQRALVHKKRANLPQEAVNFPQDASMPCVDKQKRLSQRMAYRHRDRYHHRRGLAVWESVSAMG